jgi:hypothetical protein
MLRVLQLQGDLMFRTSIATALALFTISIETNAQPCLPCPPANGVAVQPIWYRPPPIWYQPTWTWQTGPSPIRVRADAERKDVPAKEDEQSEVGPKPRPDGKKGPPLVSPKEGELLPLPKTEKKKPEL